MDCKQTSGNPVNPPLVCSRGWKKTVQTLWPIVAAVIAFAVWAVKVQTVSTNDFGQLRTRVTIIEERIPSREHMLKIHKNQAVMKSHLERILNNIDKVAHEHKPPRG